MILVDNGSTDGSIERIQKEFPDYKYILNEENLGYSKAMNIAIKYALSKGADYIFPLNNDARIKDEGCFEELINFAESDSKIGIVGPRFIFPSGSYQPSAYNIFMPSIVYLFLPNALANFILFGFGRQFYKTKEVLWVSGMFLIKKKLIENLGLFDERFFMGGEDVDYCLRARKKGWKIIYFPKKTLIHKGGESRKEGTIRYGRSTIEANAYLTYKYYNRCLAHFVRYSLTGALILRSIEWAIRSIFGKKELKFKLSKEFLKAAILTFKTIPKL